MKKVFLLGSVIAATFLTTSCGSGDADSQEGAKTVEYFNVESFEMGGLSLNIASAKLTDNFTSGEIAEIIKEGKKIIQVEVCVFNNSKVEANVPPAAFTLDDLSTKENENIEVNNIISMNMDNWELYKGSGIYADGNKRGMLYYEVDAGLAVDNLQLNVRNTADGDTQIGVLPLKQKEDLIQEEENNVLELSTNSMTIENTILEEKATVTINQVIDNFKDGTEEESSNPYFKKVKIEYAVSVQAGSFFCSGASLELKSKFFQTPTLSGVNNDMETDNLNPGEERKATAVFQVFRGDSSYTIVYSGETELDLF